MKSAKEIKKLMPDSFSIRPEEILMYQIEEAAKSGQYQIMSKNFHDDIETKVLNKIFTDLGFEVTIYGFQLWIRW
jgi:hypothetical protein